MNANTEIMNAQRKRYMDGDVSHEQYYLWLADFIGAGRLQVPFTPERIAASTDPHLNDIPLALWDRQDPIIRHMAYRKGLPWSLCDTVCVLKALARHHYGNKQAA